MTPAEFVCSRELLGLPITWVAEHLGVTERTVYRWEAGTTKIPAVMAQRMRAWVENTERIVGKVTVVISGAPARVKLETFPDKGFEHKGVEGWPASWHRMVMARVAERTQRPIVWGPAGDTLIGVE